LTPSPPTDSYPSADDETTRPGSSESLAAFDWNRWPPSFGINGRNRRNPHIIAVAVNTEGKREIVGLHIGPSEAETFWATFLKGMARRGLRGVKLVISDAHEGLKAAIRRVVGASWQRCRVHWMRNALSYVPIGP
jgi:transposase-like protein